MDQSISCFQPIADMNSKVMVLGSIPGVASLTASQYYAYPRNCFWNIIFDLFESKLSGTAHHEVPYERKIEVLKRQGIAVWDVIGSCNRAGSLDADIQNEIPNDFDTFFKNHPIITHVIFNGAKAELVYRRKVGFSPNLMYLTMPSTSPAHTLSYDKKLGRWSVLEDLI